MFYSPSEVLFWCIKWCSYMYQLSVFHKTVKSIQVRLLIQALVISYFNDDAKIRTTTVRTNAYTACPHVAFETFIYKLQSLYNNYNLCIYNCMNIYFICTVSMLGGSKPCATRNSYNIIILISHLTVSTIH